MVDICKEAYCFIVKILGDKQNIDNNNTNLKQAHCTILDFSGTGSPGSSSNSTSYSASPAAVLVVSLIWLPFVHKPSDLYRRGAQFFDNWIGITEASCAGVKYDCSDKLADRCATLNAAHSLGCWEPFWNAAR